MEITQAVRVLRKHNAELDDESDTLLDSLRPYRGIDRSHFSEIVEALYFASTLLNQKQADRDLVHTIWDLTRSARLWTAGKHEPMFHGRNFISKQDKQTLDRWIHEIESITLCLLRGFEDWEAISGLAEEMNHHDSIKDPAWLVAPFMKSLEYHLSMEKEGGFGDDEEILCKALIKIGSDAVPAMPLLERVVSDTKFVNVKSAAEHAIEALSQIKNDTDIGSDRSL